MSLFRFFFLPSVEAASKDPALANVRNVDPRKLLFRHDPSLPQESVGLTQLDPVDRVTYAASIGEMWLLDAQLKVLGERRARLVVKSVHLLTNHHLSDRHQLLERIVWKVDVMRDA